MTIRQLMEKFPDDLDTPIVFRGEGQYLGSPDIQELDFIYNTDYERWFGAHTVIFVRGEY